MNLYLGSMILTVVSNLGYHLSQRSINATINPLLSLAVTYTIALVVTLAAFPLFSSGENGPLLNQVRSANWASYALGFAIVGLELGFLLAYRAGWKVSIAALYSNALVTALLVPIGLLIFRENLDVKKIAGIALTSAGLWLIGKS